MGARSFSVDVDTGAAQGGVCEVAVVDGWLAAGSNIEAVQSLPRKLGGGGIEL